MKRKVIPITLVLSLLLSVFITACGKKEEMSQDSSGVEVTIADLDEDENETQGLLPWLQLADKTSHPELRASFEEYFNTYTDDTTKLGILYYNRYTSEHTLNNTFYNVVAIDDFANAMSDSKILKDLSDITSKEYTDIGFSDSEAPYAAINAYFELLPDTEDNTFNGSESLTRAQAMTLLMRAVTPVNEAQAPETDEDFTKCVGESVYTDFAAPMDSYAFINTNNNLNEASFTGKMTKGEYIYLISNYIIDVNLQRKKDNGITDEGLKDILDTSEVTLTSVKDGGDISLQEAIENPENGVPSDLYKVLKQAVKYGMIPQSEEEDYLSTWDDAITKSQAIEILVNLYSNFFTSQSNRLATSISYDFTKEINATTIKDEEAEAKQWREIMKDKPDNMTDNQYLSKLAQKDGADYALDLYWVYLHGSGAGDKPSYVVCMIEGSSEYGKIYHVGDELPTGSVFEGTAEEYQKWYSDSVNQKVIDEQGDDYKAYYDDDGNFIIDMRTQD